MTPHPFWMVALIGGCLEAAEYARGYADPRAALANASANYREWLQRRLSGGGYGNGYGYGRGSGPGSGSGPGYGYGGGSGSGPGDGDGGGGYGSGCGCGDGDAGFVGYGGGNGDGSGHGDVGPLRVRVGGEWWDRERALAWIAEALK